MASAPKDNPNREKARHSYLLKTYGISLVEYDRIAFLQDFKCAICSRPATELHRLAVDHKHQKNEKQKTGKERRHTVRGLLCWRCNVGLKAYNDKPELFYAAGNYLSNPPAKEVTN